MQIHHNLTKRPISVGAEDMLFRTHKVLDYGELELVDYMGNDRGVVEAARVSYAKVNKRSSDRALLRYLMFSDHTTPFEMLEAKFRARMPIFVARQWIRHRTANVNERSGRYSPPIVDFYVPNVERMQAQSTTNKQGSSNEVVDCAEDLRSALDEHNRQSIRLYRRCEEAGLAKELCRLALPVSNYTEWYWKIDVHNLLHFLNLRDDSHAQCEIRAYAKVICEIVQAWVPEVYQAYLDYRKNACRLSALEKSALSQILSGQATLEDVDYGPMSSRERASFRAKLAEIMKLS